MPQYIRLTPITGWSNVKMTVGKIYDIELTTYPFTLDERYTFIDDTGSRYYQTVYDLSRDYVLVEEFRNNKIEQIFE